MSGSQRRRGIIPFMMTHKNAVVGVVCFLLSAIITVTIPEIRCLVGLDDCQQLSKIEGLALPDSKEETIEKPSPPIYTTIQKNQPQYIQDAQTHLSIAFQNYEGEEFVSLHISPEGYKNIDSCYINWIYKRI